jgi:hypothetical protein
MLVQQINLLLPALDPKELQQAALWVRSRASYRDQNQPARICDACGTVYRGPAVYCCFDCAFHDA